MENTCEQGHRRLQLPHSCPCLTCRARRMAGLVQPAPAPCSEKPGGPRVPKGSPLAEPLQGPAGVPGPSSPCQQPPHHQGPAGEPQFPPATQEGCADPSYGASLPSLSFTSTAVMLRLNHLYSISDVYHGN